MVEKAAPEKEASAHASAMAAGGTPACFLTYQRPQGPLPWAGAENTGRSQTHAQDAAAWPAGGPTPRPTAQTPNGLPGNEAQRESPMTEHLAKWPPGQHMSHLCPGHRHSHIRGVTSRPRNEGDASPHEGTSSCSRATQLAEHSTVAPHRPPGKDGTGVRPRRTWRVRKARAGCGAPAGGTAMSRTDAHQEGSQVPGGSPAPPGQWPPFCTPEQHRADPSSKTVA